MHYLFLFFLFRGAVIQTVIGDFVIRNDGWCIGTLHDACIQDHPLDRQQVLFLQLFIKQIKQFFHDFELHERTSKARNRAMVGYLFVHTYSQKTQEGDSVIDAFFQSLVAQTIPYPSSRILNMSGAE